MTPAVRPRVVALALVVMLLVALLAMASRPAVSSGGAERANAGPVIAILHLIQIAGLAIELLALVLLIIVLRFLRRRPREDEEEEPYYEPPQVHWAVKLLVALVPLLMLGAIVYSLYRFVSTQPPAGEVPEAGGPLSPLDRNSFIGQVVANLGLAWWEVGIAVGLALLALVAIVRLLREVEPEADGDAEPAQTRALATAVRAGLRDARSEPDPRSAVIAAYATMEQILADEGFPRRAVEAPLEYMTRLFAELEISAEALRTLTDHFEVARFSQHAISTETREEAIAALTAIETELQAP